MKSLDMVEHISSKQISIDPGLPPTGLHEIKFCAFRIFYDETLKQVQYHTRVILDDDLLLAFQSMYAFQINDDFELKKAAFTTLIGLAENDAMRQVVVLTFYHIIVRTISNSLLQMWSVSQRLY